MLTSATLHLHCLHATMQKNGGKQWKWQWQWRVCCNKDLLDLKTDPVMQHLRSIIHTKYSARGDMKWEGPTGGHANEATVRQFAADITANPDSTSMLLGTLASISQARFWGLVGDFSCVEEYGYVAEHCVPEVVRADLMHVTIFEGDAVSEISSTCTAILEAAEHLKGTQYMVQNFPQPREELLNLPSGTELPSMADLLHWCVQQDAMFSRIAADVMDTLVKQGVLDADTPEEFFHAAMAHTVRQQMLRSAYGKYGEPSSTSTVTQPPADSTKCNMAVIYSPSNDTCSTHTDNGAKHQQGFSALARKHVHGIRDTSHLMVGWVRVHSDLIPPKETFKLGKHPETGAYGWLVMRGEDVLRVVSDWPPFSCSGLAFTDSFFNELLMEASRFQMSPGLNSGNLIASQVLTSTSKHQEDSLMSAYNILFGGAAKLWIILIGCMGGIYRDHCQQQQRYSLLAAKQLYNAFDNEHDAARFLQYTIPIIQVPGVAVTTHAGHAYHQTVAVGANLAEAVNLWHGWERAASDIMKDLSWWEKADFKGDVESKNLKASRLQYAKAVRLHSKLISHLTQS